MSDDSLEGGPGAVLFWDNGRSGVASLANPAYIPLVIHSQANQVVVALEAGNCWSLVGLTRRLGRESQVGVDSERRN